MQSPPLADPATRQRFRELIQHLDPETREIVCELVRRWVLVEEFIKVIEKRQH